jgi:hypothetical protein
LGISSATKVDTSTPAKRGEYRRALRALLEQRERLRQMTKRYPVMIDIANMRYVAESPSDVDTLACAIELSLAEAR